MATYKELTRSFSLRPITTHEQFAAAHAIADAMIKKEDLTKDETDYLDVLETLMEKYCESNDADFTLSPTLVLNFLHYQLNTEEALVPILGNEQRTKDFFDGKHPLTLQELVDVAKFLELDLSTFVKLKGDRNASLQPNSRAEHTPEAQVKSIMNSFYLQPIDSMQSLEAALNRVQTVMLESQSKKDGARYMDTIYLGFLRVLIETYAQSQDISFSIDAGKLLDILYAQGRTTAALIPILGSSEVVFDYFNGKRKATFEQVFLISSLLKVDYNVFTTLSQAIAA